MQLQDKVPEYIFSRENMLTNAVFTAFFSVAALILSAPFTSGRWFSVADPALFTPTVCVYALCLAVVVVSRRILYSHRLDAEMTILNLGLWVIGEILAVSFIYTVATLELGEYELLDVSSFTFGSLFGASAVFNLLAIGLPFILCGMYFAINDKDRTIRLMNFSTVISDEAPAAEERKVTLCDNSGALKLSISITNLYYIESDDNYIKVWYRSSEGFRQYMLRCRLKTVEESFEGSQLVRCHRKYVVNMDKVKVLRRDRDCYVLDLDCENGVIQPIPVTRTYEQKVLERFNDKN